LLTALFGHTRRSRQRGLGKIFPLSAAVSLAILCMIVAAAVFAPIFATHDPNKNDLASSLALPSAAHWLGCDQNGRDIFSRVLYGGRTALLGSIGVVGISILLGIPLGLICGYYSGFADTVIMRACDIILAFPTLLLAFIFVATFGRGLPIAVVAIGIVYVPMLTRLTRSLALVERNKVYVSACIGLGYSPLRIMYGHILPNCVSTIVVQLTLDLGYAILDLSGLSFLGLGVLEPTSDWGAMLGAGRSYILQNPYQCLMPGAAIVLTVISLNLFSDGLHQYLDTTQAQLPSFARYDARAARIARAKEAMGTRAVEAEDEEAAHV